MFAVKVSEQLVVVVVGTGDVFSIYFCFVSGFYQKGDLNDHYRLVRSVNDEINFICFALICTNLFTAHKRETLQL